MPYSISTRSDIKVYTKTADGLALTGIVTSSEALPTTANVFAPGAIFTNVSTGISYRNNGTIAVPVWYIVTSAAS